jgi:hypothetical protein
VAVAREGLSSLSSGRPFQNYRHHYHGAIGAHAKRLSDVGTKSMEILGEGLRHYAEVLKYRIVSAAALERGYSASQI